MDRTRQQNPALNIHPPGYQENINEQYHFSGNLWGATTRSVVGFLQIFCGVIEISVIAAFIGVALRFGFFIGGFGITELVWGLISAVLLIITGGFGRSSRRDGCKVIAFMVLNVTSALCGAYCLGFGAFVLVDIIEINNVEEWPRSRTVAGIAACSALLLTYLIHVVISIVGASFTCGAVCDCNTPNSNRRRHEALGYNYGYHTIPSSDYRNDAPTTHLLQPNAPPLNSVPQPPSYGTMQS